MSKNKKKTARAKSTKKSTELAAADERDSQGDDAQTTEEPVIRAVKVTQSILDAAKEYKKATGMSFYTLGHDTIKERLVKEGYLKEDCVETKA